MMGVYNILYMIQRGELREDLREKSLVTYVAGLFRSIRFFHQIHWHFVGFLSSLFRFGVAESHGRGAALQLNTYLNDGAVTHNNGSGKYEVREKFNHEKK